MTSNSDLMSDSEQEDAFEVQMRGYSRRQVDEFVARSRTQIRELEERLSRSLDDAERLRLELSAARQGLSNKPAHEEVSERVGQILKLAEDEAKGRRPACRCGCAYTGRRGLWARLAGIVIGGPGKITQM